MARITDPNPAAQRRAAQRRLAREIQGGTYQRGTPGRAYEQARQRQSVGSDLGERETRGGIVYHSRRFSNVGDAARWGQSNLPTRTRCLLIGFGRLVTLSGDDEDLGKMVYRTLYDLIAAGSLVSFIPQVEAEAQRLFTDMRFVVLQWEE